jgi:hypothetical protein
MIGVAGPRFGRDRPAAVVFSAAYSGAFLTSSLLVGGLVALAVAAVTAPVALPVTASIVLLLGLLDVLDSTPTLRRQTPKMWIHRLPFTTTGLLWGLDIGSAVTTVKMTSLLWAALVLSFTAPPGTAVLAMAAFATVVLSGHWVATIRVGRAEHPAVAVVALPTVPQRVLRRISGTTLIILAGVLLGLSGAGWWP